MTAVLPEQGQIQFGSATIFYTVERRNRRTLALQVQPNGRLTVAAPLAASAEDIAAVVGKRAAWVLTQQERASHIPAPAAASHYRSGESLYHLGRQHRLRVLPGTPSTVVLEPTRLLVTTRDPRNGTAVGRLVERWYRQQAQYIIAEVFERILTQLPPLLFPAVAHPSMRLLHMPRRWGSFVARTNTILLNPALVKTPRACIEYIIFHELAHLRQPRHDRAFYDLQTRLLPEWQHWEARLHELEPLLLTAAAIETEN
ncbi:MAG: M48 family metallopeptidase [Bacteroidota bacterium]|nr:M48 family metallopeptidase [Bacteroidota bacterium]